MTSSEAVLAHLTTLVYLLYIYFLINLVSIVIQPIKFVEKSSYRIIFELKPHDGYILV